MSNDFWNKIKKVFSSNDDTPSNIPLIHEVIKRSDREIDNYEKWKASVEKDQMINWLNSGFVEWLVNPKEKQKGMDFLASTSSNGFVLFFDQLNYSPNEILSFFDYCKEKILVLNYKAALSDTRTFNKPKYVETIQKHYLKPRIKIITGEKSDQLYGNIKIELVSKDDQFQHLKFSATIYNDQHYKAGLSFKELMQELLG